MKDLNNPEGSEPPHIGYGEKNKQTREIVVGQGSGFTFLS